MAPADWVRGALGSRCDVDRLVIAHLKIKQAQHKARNADHAERRLPTQRAAMMPPSATPRTEPTEAAAMKLPISALRILSGKWVAISAAPTGP